MSLSDWLLVAAAIAGVLALMLAGSALGRPRGRLLRWFGVSLLLGLALPLGGLGLLLRQYHWLLDDQPVATLALRQLAPQRFQATLVPTGKPALQRELLGDEWQLDARWGSAAYLPMLDGATYRVTINPRGGLVAAPADVKTEALLRSAGW